MIPLLALLSPAVAGDGQITLLITNATEVARKERGAALITVASVFMDVDKKTQKVIATRMSESLIARGIEAKVEPATISFPSPNFTAFYLWDPTASALMPVTLALGEYQVLQVNVQNPDEIVAAETSSLVVGMANLFGYDLKQEVNARAAPILLQELQAQGVQAVAAW